MTHKVSTVTMSLGLICTPGLEWGIFELTLDLDWRQEPFCGACKTSHLLCKYGEISFYGPSKGESNVAPASKKGLIHILIDHVLLAKFQPKGLTWLYFTVPHTFPWSAHGVLMKSVECLWSAHGVAHMCKRSYVITNFYAKWMSVCSSKAFCIGVGIA